MSSLPAITPSPPAEHLHNHRHHPTDNPAGPGADRGNPLLLAGLLRPGAALAPGAGSRTPHPTPPSAAGSRTLRCSRSAPDGASRLTDPLHVPVRLVRPSSRVVLSPVILVTLLESNRMPERKSLTVRVICRKKGGALRIRPEGGVPGPKASRPHPVSSTSPAARGRQQSLPLWKSFITASIFRETSAL